MIVLKVPISFVLEFQKSSFNSYPPYFLLQWEALHVFLLNGYHRNIYVWEKTPQIEQRKYICQQSKAHTIIHRLYQSVFCLPAVIIQLNLRRNLDIRLLLGILRALTSLCRNCIVVRGQLRKSFFNTSFCIQDRTVHELVETGQEGKKKLELRIY